MSSELFSKRIEEICKDVGSAEKLGKLSGLSGHTIRTYLKAGREPSRQNLIAMSKAASVNLLWLATGEGPKYPRIEKAEKKSLEERLIELQKDYPQIEITMKTKMQKSHTMSVGYGREIIRTETLTIGEIYRVEPINQKMKKNQGRICTILEFDDDFAPSKISVRFHDNNRKGTVDACNLVSVDKKEVLEEEKQASA